jgi:predicted dehydrogenase
MDSRNNPLTRRDFVGAAAAMSALAATGNYAFAQGSDTIKVGLIGCGGRGKGAIWNCVSSSPNVVVWALGDLFENAGGYGVNSALEAIKGLGDKNKVTKDRCFSGFDNYKHVIDSGVDLIIDAAPPGFRPVHLRYAVEKGKHIFTEKPVATDAPGIRMNLETYQLALQKGLGIAAGTQRRHQLPYIETIKRIHEGAIGKVVGGQVYWNGGGLWHRGEDPKWSEMEYQCHNWYYFTWLCGDHIVEQHVHNLDVANWVLQAHPEKCVGLGGRQVRVEPKYGHIYDHFAIDYTYPGEVHILSMCRQQDNTAGNVSERFVGTKGMTNAAGWIRGEATWRYEGPNPDPYTQEHADLISSIRSGKPINELKNVTESTLTAIMGRMACYTGKEITWEMALNSQEKLVPDDPKFGPMPVPPVAMPGRTPFL